MGGRPKHRQLQSREDFERALQEEISVSNQFDLPLCVLVAVMEGGWDPESEGRAVGALRLADLVSRTDGPDLIVVLSNTALENARAVERRLRQILPGTGIGISELTPGDTAQRLVERARQAALRNL